MFWLMFCLSIEKQINWFNLKHIYEANCSTFTASQWVSWMWYEDLNCECRLYTSTCWSLALLVLNSGEKVWSICNSWSTPSVIKSNRWISVIAINLWGHKEYQGYRAYYEYKNMDINSDIKVRYIQDSELLEIRVAVALAIDIRIGAN